MEQLTQAFQKCSLLDNFTCIQSNGQRISTNTTTSKLHKASKGCEIFVGNLPHDLYEDELIPLFSRAGKIHTVRLMMDFCGNNRGYAFISFVQASDANLAVVYFNKYRVRPNTKLAVSLSVDNRRLFVGNIPRDKTAEELHAVFEKYVGGIVEVILYNEPFNKMLNRGFAFVEFETHREAAIARRHLSPGNLEVWGKAVFVDWAEPLPLVDPHVLNNVTKLYLSNIPYEVRNEQLIEFLNEKLNPDNILKVHKCFTYAFVHFIERSHAEKAKIALTGCTLMGNEIQVEWARPIEYSKRHRACRVPDNFCKSVPPNMRKLVNESIALRQWKHQVEKQLRSNNFADKFIGTEFGLEKIERQVSSTTASRVLF